MGCYLLLMAVAFGFLDLYLMADIFESFGFMVGLACLFLPSMLLGPVALRQRHRLVAQAQASPQTMPGNLTESLLLVVASGFFVFPGPISTLLGVLLLLSPVRRLIIALGMRSLAKSLSSPGPVGPAGGPGGGPVFIRVVSVNGQTQVSTSGSPAGPPVQGPARAPGGLKTVEGRTLDDDEAHPLLTDGSDSDGDGAAPAEPAPKDGGDA